MPVYGISTLKEKIETKEDYQMFQFYEAFRTGFFDPDEKFQCRTMCRHYYTSSFPTLKKIFESKILSSKFMRMFNKGWAIDDEYNPILSVRKSAQPEGNIAKIFGEKPHILGLDFRMDDLTDLMVKRPSKNYTLVLYIT